MLMSLTTTPALTYILIYFSCFSCWYEY